MSSSSELNSSMNSSFRIIHESEKDQLRDLNDRLQNLFHHSEKLEADLEEQKLLLIRRTSEHELKIKDTERRHEREIVLIRSQLEKITTEKTTYQLDAENYKTLYEDEKNQVATLTVTLKDNEKKIKVLSRERDDLSNRLSEARSDLSQAEKDLDTAKGEAAKYKKLYEETLRKFESEQLAKNDLQLKLEMLRSDHKDLKAKAANDSKEAAGTISELKYELREQKEKLKSQFSGHLQEALAEVRERYETEAQHVRTEFAAIHLPGGHDGSALAEALDSIRRLEDQIGDLERENRAMKGLHAQIARLEATIASLKDDAIAVGRQHAKALSEKSSTIFALHSKIEELQKNFIPNTEAPIDSEITLYREILDQHEKRFNITPSPKRKRPAQEESRKSSREESSIEISSKSYSSSKSSKSSRSTEVHVEQFELSADTETSGQIYIEEINLDGLFVKLRNLTSDNLSLNGWTVTSLSSDDNKSSTYTFSKASIAANGVLTLWADSALVEKDIVDNTSNFLFSGQTQFFVGPNTETVVKDPEGADASHTWITVAGSTGATNNHEEIFNQTGDPDADISIVDKTIDPPANQQDNCSIM